MPRSIDVVVAGHICLDIIPTFLEHQNDLSSIFVPGKLCKVGPAVIATGGAVSNTGIALHRLGIPSRLMGKVGKDAIGASILEVVGGQDPCLTDGMIVDPTVDSSYTVVISPPGIDRMFMHGPGANDTFTPDDMDLEKLADARLFHFGYPSLMRSMYSDNGVGLESMFARIKKLGLTTSLDLAYVDPDSDAGKINWHALLKRTLPQVDVFLPSLDEVLWIIDPECLEGLEESAATSDAIAKADGDTLSKVSGELIEMGAAIVVLKLGDKGLYLRTTGDPARLKNMGACTPSDEESWLGREIFAPCFSVKVCGTTGAGDCAIAGFLASLVKGYAPKEAATTAAAVGACNVEKADSFSGITTLDEVKERIARDWERNPVTLPLPGWHEDKETGLVIGPHDHSSRK